MILTIIGVAICFYVICIWWFLHRLGDKLGKDRRWWVKALDGVLITPLFPLFFIIRFTKNRNR